MGKLQLDAVPSHSGSSYPAPFDQIVDGRSWQRLGEAGGLTQFGVNLTRIWPGQWSSQRHWHSQEDEFVYMIAGELVLVTDAGERTMVAGDCAAFAANTPDGHHLFNRSDAVAVYLAVGSRRDDDVCTYPDIDMLFDPQADAFVHRDGRPYPAKQRSNK